MTSISPSALIAQRRLGLQLRTIRTEAGHTQETLAEAITAASGTAFSRDRVSSLERGKSWPGAADLETILDCCRTPEALRIEIRTMVREGRALGGNWWDQHGEVPRALARLIAFEDAAERVIDASNACLPGLLQTRSYIEALFQFSAFEAGAGRTQTLTDIRLRRQGVLTRPDNPLILEGLVCESALRAQVGGRDVMRQQLGHLLEQMDLPNITMRVLPFSAGAPVALTTPATILDFPGSESSIVANDVRSGVDFEEDPREVRAARRRMDYLAQAALGPVESVDLIHRIHKEM